MKYAAILLLLSALPAHSAGVWERFDPFPGVYWEYDTASVIVLPDNQRRILARMTLSGTLEDKTTGKHYDHAVYLIELDCAKRLMRVVDVVLYLRAERVQPSRTEEAWRPAPPTSTLHKAACG